MSRRTTASVAGAGLLVVLWILATVVSVPYVIYRPGPTVNLLGKDGGKPIVRVPAGTKVYRDGGALRLLTVVPSQPGTRISLAQMMFAWVSPSQAVYRYSDIYQQSEDDATVEEEGQVEMTSSQDSAVAAALRQLGYDVPESVQVLGIQRGGPGDGALEVHDHLLRVDGTKVTSIQKGVSLIRAKRPGTPVRLRVERSGKELVVTVRTVAAKDDPKASALRITIGTGYDFPIDVSVRIRGGIGGPSAGTMFSMAIYDTLTPGSLTGGNDIAGTGTIDGDGKVGGIGGIQQKLSAAQRDGAHLFLAPAANCDEVRGGPYDADTMRVVKISTLKGAIADVKAWRQDHDATLPSCG